MSETFTGGFWGVLELMGHVKLAGYITEEEKFATKLGRIDIPGPDNTIATQYFAGGAIYRLTPTTEEIARATATANQPRPVQLWEVPALQRAAERALRVDDDLAEADADAERAEREDRDNDFEEDETLRHFL